MVKTIDILLKAYEEAEAARETYRLSAAQAAQSLNAILKAGETADAISAMAAFHADHAQSVGKMLASLKLPPITLPPLLDEEVYGYIKTAMSTYVSTLDPMRDMFRAFDETWRQTLQSMVGSFRLDVLTGLSEGELLALAAQVAAEPEIDAELSISEGSFPAGRETTELDPIRKIALLAIFVALLVLVGKMPVDRGWLLIELLVASLPLLAEYSRRE
ncbi:MAG TPA: hypothetical protein VGR43_01560 [Dehalococcoidia bacterium]|jgi:hypothetical protein|nr:hypothetical protein [Dehalococcoidia bacterium]